MHVTFPVAGMAISADRNFYCLRLTNVKGKAVDSCHTTRITDNTKLRALAAPAVIFIVPSKCPLAFNTLSALASDSDVDLQRIEAKLEMLLALIHSEL